MNKKTEKKQEAKSSKRKLRLKKANLQLPARSRIKSNALDS